MADNFYDRCTEHCERQVKCVVCHKTKKPSGRDAPAACANSYCDSDCSGYYQDPMPGHLWPGELARIKEATDG